MTGPKWAPLGTDMKHLILSLAPLLAIAGCGQAIDFWNKPTPDELSRQAAMDRCIRELEAKLPSFIEEGKKGLDGSKLGGFLSSDEYREVEITQSYCKSEKNEKFNGMGYAMGFLEWVEKPTKENPGDTSVQKVIVIHAIHYLDC